MNNIAVLTSGGDAPGMNAAIRAVVRTALYHGIRITGIKRGYAGLIEGDFIEMRPATVNDVMQKGGTFLLSARCDEFRTAEGRQKAFENLQQQEIEGLVIIGGDGSLKGAQKLYKEHGIPFIGVPGTIDNDLAGTDYTIGFDTAMNNIVDAINKIRDTATSHERTFIIETMGRTTGYLTLMAGLAGGADAILIPEENFDLEEICETLKKRQEEGRLHNIVLVAEGVGGDFKTNRDINESNAFSIGRIIAKKTGQETRIIILGHLQRGGSPTVADRIRASKLGGKAVELLLAGKTNVMVGLDGNQLICNNVEKILDNKKEIDPELFTLNKILSI